MNDQAYLDWKARQVATMNAVSCPRCKAQVGQPCIWGTTNTGNVHTPRSRKAKKATAR